MWKLEEEEASHVVCFPHSLVVVLIIGTELCIVYIIWELAVGRCMLRQMWMAVLLIALKKNSNIPTGFVSFP